MLFRSRDHTHAGEFLTRQLQNIALEKNPLVLALPRGGVPIGFVIATTLLGDLDVLVVRKLGVPGQEELAMGTFASGGIRVLNEALIAQLGVSQPTIQRVTVREQEEIEWRERMYREGRPAIPIRGRTVILVDDGLATAPSMLAAVRSARTQQAGRIVVALPVAAYQACREVREYVDELICAYTPEPFYAVGIWYEHFSQTSDAEVQKLLERSLHEQVT